MTIRSGASFPLWILLCAACVSWGFEGPQADEAAIRRYSKQAEQALAAKDLDAAAAALEKLARLTPNVPEVHANLGTVYYTEGRYAQAAEALERALKLNPKLPNAELILGICDAELGRAGEAVRILAPAFQRPPNDVIGRSIGIKLMESYIALERNPQALEVSEQLLQRYPDDPEILYRAAHAYGDRALQAMNRLAAVAPRSPWKLMAFAEALESRKRYDSAITEYRRVTTIDPDMLGAHYRLGRSMLLNAPDSEKAQDDAMKEFQAALALDPRNAGAEYEMGEIYRRRGQPKDAVAAFSRAVQIDPRFEEAQIGLARSLISLQMPKEALPHLRAALKLNPTNEVPHFLLAGVYKSLGDAASAGHEMALYQETHARAFAEKTAGEDPRDQSAPEVTRQTLDSSGHP